MKKATILAVSVVAIAVLAVWFVREQSGSEQISSPVAGAVESSLAIAEPQVVSPEANGPNHETPESESAQADPVKVFSRVEVFDDEYRNASLEAGAILAKLTDPPVLRSQILLTDQGLISEFIRQVTSDGLTQAFDVSPFMDDICTVSTVDRTSPTFTPGGAVPNAFMVYSDCDSADKQSTAWVNMSERSVSFFMTYGLTSYTVRPLGNSKYSLAFQSHFGIPEPGADGPPVVRDTSER